MSVSFAREAVRSSLEARRRELAAALATHDSIAAVRSPDEIDNITLAADREVATADLERKSRLVRQITEALMRLNAGEYGRCVGCGVGIAPQRLFSVPWTPYCLRCQEAREHEERTGGDSDVPG